MVKIMKNKTVCLLPNYEVAYINSPLNGCTTTKILLARAAGHSEIHNKEIHDIFSPGNLVSGLGVASDIEKVPDDWFVFTNVRNPFDRIVSFYIGKWMPQENQKKPLLYDQYGPYDWDKSFLEFTKWLKEFGLYDVDSHAMTQWDNLQIQEVDSVVRFERFEDDLISVLESNDIPFDKIPNLNQKSRQDNYKEYYNSEAKEIISELYQIDLKNLNYEF